MPRSLLTERDGRRLAIAMLKKGARVGPDAACLWPDQFAENVRPGRPQNNFVLPYLVKALLSNPEVIKGFAAQLSDFVSQHAEENPDQLSLYEELEARYGVLDDPKFRAFIAQVTQ